jgi:hypothetical protein
MPRGMVAGLKKAAWSCGQRSIALEFDGYWNFFTVAVGVAVHF